MERANRARDRRRKEAKRKKENEEDKLTREETDGGRAEAKKRCTGNETGVRVTY